MPSSPPTPSGSALTSVAATATSAATTSPVWSPRTRATSGPRYWSGAHDRGSVCVMQCPPASRSVSSGAPWWRFRSSAFAASCDRLGLFVFQTQAEHRLQVVRRELLKGDHRLRLLDAVELGQPLGHNLGELVMLAHARDRDEVPLASEGVDLSDALDVREVGTEARQALARRLHQDEGGEHETILCSGKLSRSGT